MAGSVTELKDRLGESIKKAQALRNHGLEQASRLGHHYGRIFDGLTQRRDEALAQLPVPLRAAWDDIAWQTWTPDKAIEQPFIRIGRLVEKRDSAPRWVVPAFAPFLGQGRVIVIRTPSSSAEVGKSLLQSLVLRTSLMLPHRARYTLIDPAGAGAAFPMRRHLAPHVRENTGHLDRDLREVNEDIRRVIETYLDATIDTFEKIPPEIRVNERYQFVFAADFPNEYDRESINELFSIGNKGPRAGVYLVLHHNTGYPLPRDLSLDSLKASSVIDISVSRSRNFSGFTIEPDSAPDPELQRKLFETLARTRPPEHVVDWDALIKLKETDWWRGSAITRIEAPVGVRGGVGTFGLYFGVDTEGRHCVHGLLAAMPGAGKSSLYHSLIVSLALSYSPAELRLYLIDGKNGVEFQAYRHLPHSEVVALQTQPELARAVLNELVAEMSRRNELFQRSKVSDFQTYRQLQNGTLPRILLVVDEYQELFEGDLEGKASDALLKLSSMGRSAGIHLLLGSQKFTATGMEHRAAILDNFHLRIGMQMQRDAVEALTEFGRRGKALLLACDMPGKVVINDRSGDDNANLFGKIAYLKPERRNQLVARLSDLADSLEANQLPRRAVFNGRSQPSLLENAQLMSLVDLAMWPKPLELEALARFKPEQGGLGLEHWYAAEQPRVAWLGQMFTVRGLAQVVLRRSAGENVIVVGDNNAARYGMLAAMVVSTALNVGPADTEFDIIDRSITGSQWNAVLTQTAQCLLQPSGFRFRLTRQADDLERYCSSLLEELQRRRSLSEGDRAAQSTRLVLLTELDTIDFTRRVLGQFGMADGPGSKVLSRLLTEGPPLGIHFVLSFARLAQARQVLDPRAQLPLLSHRVALQMAEMDSHDLIGDRSAARLQSEGPMPVCAVYRNFQAGTSAVRFKPYTTEPQGENPEDALSEQIRMVGERVRKRKS